MKCDLAPGLMPIRLLVRLIRWTVHNSKLSHHYIVFLRLFVSGGYYDWWRVCARKTISTYMLAIYNLPCSRKCSFSITFELFFGVDFADAPVCNDIIMVVAHETNS